jgi:hypothetical protein
MKTELLRNTAAALALALGAASGAAAQSGGAGQPSYQQAPAGIEPVSDAEVRTFVIAVSEVSEIVDDYRPQLQSADTEEEAAAIQQVAQEEMIMAVTQNGMELERYNNIMSASRQDVELSQRIAAEAQRYEREQNGG